MRVFTLFISLFIVGAASINAKSVKEVDHEGPENEEEVKERRDIHKPGQMSQGYDHDDDEKQQDINGKDPDTEWGDDDAIKGTGGDLNLKGYPIQ